MKISDKAAERISSTLAPLLDKGDLIAHKASAVIQASLRKDAKDDEDGRWVTTQSGKKMFINGEGEPTKGNPRVLAAAKGESSTDTSSGSYDPDKRLGRKALQGMEVGSQVVTKDGRVLTKTGDRELPWHDRKSGDKYSDDYLANTKEGSCSPVEQKQSNDAPKGKVFKPKSGYEWDYDKKKNVLVEDIGPLQKMHSKNAREGQVATVALADGSVKKYTAKMFRKPGFIPGIYWEDNDNSKKQFGANGGTLASEFRNGVISVDVK